MRIVSSLPHGQTLQLVLLCRAHGYEVYGQLHGSSIADKVSRALEDCDSPQVRFIGVGGEKTTKTSNVLV